jgi:hypothetical protein
MFFFPKRLQDKFKKEKTKKELDAHYKSVKLEKGDFPAMVIAAIITFFPVLFIAMIIIYGLLWIFLL